MSHILSVMVITILVIVIIAAITPPDPMTMLYYGSPCLVLSLMSYTLGVRNGREAVLRQTKKEDAKH